MDVAKTMNMEMRPYEASTLSFITRAMGTPMRHNTTTLYTLIPVGTEKKGTKNLIKLNKKDLWDSGKPRPPTNYIM